VQVRQVRIWLAAAVLASAATATKARADKKGDDDTVDATDDDAKPSKKKPKDDGDDAKPKSDDEVDATDDDAKPKKKKDEVNEEAQKQDLTGHDLGTHKKENEFERDRFYVDKVDSGKSDKGTLIQGSLAETTFLYMEGGGLLGANNGQTLNSINSSASPFTRLYTELRYQSDFRHIGGGIWDARIDARIRIVDQPDPTNGTGEGNITGAGQGTIEELKTQSGLFGGNEYDLREAYFVRNGARSDIFIGRQWITDLGAVKIDGVRIDYASSKTWTILGFGGLYPLLGSRSLTTDYVNLQTVTPNGTLASEGNFVGAAGGGAAYRTANAYGAVGGVALVPFQGEDPRIFATSNGYWRFGNQLDFYHYAVIDFVGSNAVNAGITNLSAGVNYKPSPRLRITGSYNRVDTQTLNVQAGAYLNSANTGNAAIDNTVYIQRIATDELRGSVAAGLGELQRFEITSSLTYRERPDVTLTSIAGTMNGVPATFTADLPAEQSVEAYASITDRRSIAGLRLGLDGLQTFGVGSTSYAHTNLFSVRLSAAHDIAGGRGDWEAEIAYTSTADDNRGQTCNYGPAGPGAPPNSIGLANCFGSSSATLLSIGGSVYYRLNRSWFGLASLFLTQDSVTGQQGPTIVTDAPVTGFTGFLRVAYRF
jgi:hypothetical protein